MFFLCYSEIVMKNALITGVSGGMGFATAKELISQGYEVYGLDVHVVDEFDHFHFYQTDLRSESSIFATFQRIRMLGVGIDFIIHLAGIYSLNSLVEMSEQDYQRIYDINVNGVYRVNKIFLPILNKDGKIIITTSELAALDPLPFTGIYGITKAALDKYAYSLRMELQLLGYQVVVIRPGAVSTGLLDTSTKELDKFTENTTLYSYNAKKFKEIVDKVESRKIPPEKIAKLIYKITTKKKPRYVYSINRNVGLILLSALPKRLQNYIIKKILTSK